MKCCRSFRGKTRYCERSPGEDECSFDNRQELLSTSVAAAEARGHCLGKSECCGVSTYLKHK